MSPGTSGLKRTGKRASCWLSCEPLEQRQMLDGGGLYFDFDTASSPLAEGYTRVTPAVYSPLVGFGWERTGIVARDYGFPKDNLLARDVHIGVSNTFMVDLPNGTYDVTPLLGNPKVYADKVSIFLEGNRVASNLTTTRGKFVEPTFRVTITDGRLDLRLVDGSGRGPWFGIAALTIEPVAPLDTSPPPPADQPPTADAGVDLVSNEASSVQFNGAAGGGAGALSYSWDFGDGSTSSGSLTPTHAYADNGQYTVLLTVTDANGLIGQDTALVTVNNVAPTAGHGGPYAGTTGVAVSFNGAASDPSWVDSGSLTYSWSFGDGATSSQAKPTHVYAAAGSYNVTLTVADKDGGAHSVTTTATIADPPAPPGAPVANAGPDLTSDEASTVQFNGTASGGTGPLSYSWTFGDGGTSFGTLTPTHVYADNGQYAVTLTVTDSAGLSSQDTSLVTVKNVAPTALFGNSGPVNEGSSVTLSFSNPTDPSSTDASAGYKYSYDFNNDGVFDIVDSTSAAQLHTFTDNGAYTVKGRIQDKDGGFTDYTTLVTVNNVAPTAGFGNSGPVNEGSAVTLSFSNPTDPSSTDANAGYKYSYDFNNDGVFDVVDSTSGSRLHTFADNGVYTVKGRIKDKDGGFTDYTTLVTVNNVAPTASHGGPYTGTTGVAVSFNGSASDPSAVDSGSLSYSWSFGDGGTSNVAKPSHAFASAGTYTVTLTVSDKDGGSHSVTTTAAISDPAPPPSGPDLEFASYTGIPASPREVVFINSGPMKDWRVEGGSAFSTTPPAGFPVVKKYGPLGAGSDGYIALYDAQNKPVALVLIGGTGVDRGYGVAVDPTGTYVYLFGQTSSGDFPTTPGAADRTKGANGRLLGPHGSALDGYVAKFEIANFNLVYSTFVGGDTGTDGARGGGAVGPDGSAYVFGFTESTDMPAAINQNTTVGDSGFITKVSPDGSRIEWTRYLGGGTFAGGEVDAQGRIYIHGGSNGQNTLITSDAFQKTFGGGPVDDYVAILNPDGSVRYASYFGGNGEDWSEHGGSILTDANGNATHFVFSGATNSTNLPTKNPIQAAYAGGMYDAYVAMLDVQTGQLSFSTYLGGSGLDSAFSAAVDNQGNIYLSANTESANLPVTSNAFDKTYNGAQDSYLAKLAPSGGGQYRLDYLTYFGGNGDDYARYVGVNADGTLVAIVGELRNSTNLPVTNGSQLASGGVDSFTAVFRFP